MQEEVLFFTNKASLILHYIRTHRNRLLFLQSEKMVVVQQCLSGNSKKKTVLKAYGPVRPLLTVQKLHAPEDLPRTVELERPLFLHNDVFRFVGIQHNADVSAHSEHHWVFVLDIREEVGAVVKRLTSFDLAWGVEHISGEVPLLFDLLHEALQEDRLVVSRAKSLADEFFCKAEADSFQWIFVYS